MMSVAVSVVALSLRLAQRRHKVEIKFPNKFMFGEATVNVKLPAPAAGAAFWCCRKRCMLRRDNRCAMVNVRARRG
jgi:hypothetical protein